MQNTSTFERNSALLYFRGAMTFEIPVCSLSSLGGLSHFGKVKYHQRTFLFSSHSLTSACEGN